MFQWLNPIWSWFRSIAFFLREAVTVIIRAGLVFLFLALILATLFLILACTARIQIASAQLSNTPVTGLTVFHWFSRLINFATGTNIDVLSVQQQGIFAASFSDLSLTIFALVLTLLSFAQFLRDKILNRYSGLIKSHRLHPNGEPRIMQRYYKNALALTLISGDFSFIQNNEELLATLRRLRDEEQLWLFSHKSREQVENAMGNVFGEFESLFQFDHRHHIHCSMVQYPTGTVFLYREHHEAAGERTRAYIYALRERARSHALLRALSTLTGHSDNMGPEA